jgi:hypothetical protein
VPANVKITDAHFELARQYEARAISLSQVGVTASPNLPRVPSSSPGEVVPVAINVKDSYAYTLLGGTSKGNTAHYVFEYITRMKQAIESLQNSDITSVVPYLEQCKIYLRRINRLRSEIVSITIAAANTYQGWENKIIFLDLTAAEHLGGAVGFVGDKHRLAVMATCQSQFLVTVGDFRCLFKPGETEESIAEERTSKLAEFTASISRL